MKSLREDKVFTNREAAEYLRVHPMTLAKWRTEGKGPRFIRLSNKKIGYKQSECDVWLDGNTFASTAEASLPRRPRGRRKLRDVRAG